MQKSPELRVGVIGSGYIARGLIHGLKNHQDYSLSSILTRRSVSEVSQEIGIKENFISNDLDVLLRQSDVAVLTTGDPLYGTDVSYHSLQYGLPVITMDAELQITTGSYLSQLGYFSESYGDQPGTLAELNEEVSVMGFKPKIFGNVKGFLNHNPDLEEMLYWGKKQGISLQQVTSFTDGTKLQIEQTLVANGLSAGIAKPGLIGPNSSDLKSGAKILLEYAQKMDKPLSDYVLPKVGNPGVFMVAEAEESLLPYLSYFKVRLDDSPYFLLERPYHLCNFEIFRMLKRFVNERSILLNNGVNPTVSVAAIAKHDLLPGDKIQRGIGGFDVRGEAININDSPTHLPIGLLQDATINSKIEKGDIVSFSSVDIPDTLAKRIWLGNI